jgi:hypothetical protein
MMISTNQLRKNRDKAKEKMDKSFVNIKAVAQEMQIENAFGEEITQELKDKMIMMLDAYTNDLEEFKDSSNALAERLKKK